MRWLIRLFVSIALIMGLLGGIAWQQYQQFLTTPLNTGDAGYVYIIKPGSHLLQISRDLSQAGLTDFPPFYFYLYGRYKHQAQFIKAGEYRIMPGTTFPQLLDQFVAGKVIQYALTIIEGITAKTLLTQIKQDKHLISTLKTGTLAEVMHQLGKPDHHGEGEFLPETYYFPAGTTDIQLLSRAHRALWAVLNQEWTQRAKGLPYQSPYEALIMASIIEKETALAQERAQIAGVFVRRLKKGMRLQTDPTVIYGLGDQYDGNIRRKDLRKDTPYNTYTRSGLPPTPIALPSRASIIAALHPAPGNSLYFVATGEGGRHVFSDTLAAHNRAVRKYQLKQK